jgi:hypothetical protein
MKRVRLTERMAAEKSSGNSKTAADKSTADKKKKENNRSRGELSRNLDGFEYDTSKAKILKKALHNINVSLGTLISAMKDLSILRGSEITPDGNIGGRGFIMPFKEVKSVINEAVTNLSDITDSIADELTNPKWGLSPSEKKKVKDEVEEVDENIEEVEDITPEVTEEVSEEVVEDNTSEDAPEPPSVEEINPDDIVDSFEVDSLKRYGNFVEGNAKDRIASVLSKNIVANLTKGE